MGYSTRFEGTLTIEPEPNVALFVELKKYLGKDMRKLDTDYAEAWDCTYIDLELTEDMLGIQWDGGEKTYGMVACINWVTTAIRKQFLESGFSLTGELKAAGEEAGDRWILRMVDGVATKVETPPTGARIECPHCESVFRVEDGKVVE